MSCDRPAVALLTFSPHEAKAWLYDLTQPDPTGGIMLCRKHANATVVPMSWQLVDARDPAWPGPPSSDEEIAFAQASVADETIEGVSTAQSYTRSSDDEMGQVVELPLINLTPATPPPAPAPTLSIRADELALLPSDTVLDNEFEALGADLPITPQPYTPELVEVGAARAPDPALFELPIADVSSPHSAS